jgi:hypothetical protein
LPGTVNLVNKEAVPTAYISFTEEDISTLSQIFLSLYGPIRAAIMTEYDCKNTLISAGISLFYSEKFYKIKIVTQFFDKDIVYN